MKEIVQLIKMKMADLIWYWDLLTEFDSFLSVNFCQTNNKTKNKK